MPFKNFIIVNPDLSNQLIGGALKTIKEIVMGRKKPLVGMITAGIILIVSTSLWLGSATPVNAQCGSQSSSCKNCHEVQGEMPVNADGTGWHQSHAFGDFCYICHAGNNQATDKAEAHVGMVPPLTDIQASCQQCHVADLEERAEVYATTLGVDIGAGAGDTGNATTGGIISRLRQGRADGIHQVGHQ